MPWITAILPPRTVPTGALGSQNLSATFPGSSWGRGQRTALPLHHHPPQRDGVWRLRIPRSPNAYSTHIHTCTTAHRRTRTPHEAAQTHGYHTQLYTQIHMDTTGSCTHRYTQTSHAAVHTDTHGHHTQLYTQIHTDTTRGCTHTHTLIYTYPTHIHTYIYTRSHAHLTRTHTYTPHTSHVNTRTCTTETHMYTHIIHTSHTSAHLYTHLHHTPQESRDSPIS